MHRFRGNVWDYTSRPQVMQTLGYPLAMNDRIPEITEARNIELGLGLQVLLFRLCSNVHNNLWGICKNNYFLLVRVTKGANYHIKK